MRKMFIAASLASLLVFSALSLFVWNGFWWILGFITIFIIVGITDILQTKHSLWRNFPVLGRLRWLMEAMRPKLYQYFVESDTDGKPINRIDRSTIFINAQKRNWIPCPSGHRWMYMQKVMNG